MKRLVGLFLNDLISNTPILGKFARKVFHLMGKNNNLYSKDYWTNRYKNKRSSGLGSYGKLAKFKSEVINKFVHENRIESIIEFGSGDGNQLKYAKYPNYLGFDVSPDVVSMCRKIFAGDSSKTFLVMDEYRGETAELGLSLDVIYHLVEDEEYEQYMKNLFTASLRYVIIYSSNMENCNEISSSHVRHRAFTDWIEGTCDDWKLIRHVPNRHPPGRFLRIGSPSDFFTYQKIR